jgi:hypothetical protein
MEKEAFFKSTPFKIATPILIFASLIYIFKHGYFFGQWLYGLTH